METRCKACNEKIQFIKSNKTQKSMPCNVDVIKIITVDGGIAIGFIPHWATCTKPEAFRKIKNGSEVILSKYGIKLKDSSLEK